QYCDAEATFFRDLVEGVVREQLKIDPLIDKQLAEGWRLTRVDSILRAILRAGAYEILSRDDVPARVAISEYVDIAHAFFADEEPKVVNGILDRLGHRERPREFAAEGRGDGLGSRPRRGEWPWRVRHHRPLFCPARDRPIRAVASRRRRRASPARGSR